MLLTSSLLNAKDYNASMFGVKSNGITMNTNSIQKGIDFVSENGGGNPAFAKVGLDELDKVPEMGASYPEFSMFKELPAWGFYVRHAKGITFENVTLTCGKKDYRTAIVLDDVTDADIRSLKVSEPERKKEPVYSYKSTLTVRNKTR